MKKIYIEKSLNGINFLNIFKHVIICLTSCFIFLSILSGLLTFINYNDESLPTLVNLTNILFITISSIFSTLNARVSGWLHGLITGFFYFFVIYGLNIIATRTLSLSPRMIPVLLTYVFIGIIGGIIGINLGNKRSKKAKSKII